MGGSNRQNGDEEGAHLRLFDASSQGPRIRGVVVMACDDEVIPHQERIESVSDESELEEVYQTERHLLYVACTRARDSLLVTGVTPASEFLDDLIANPANGNQS